MLASVFVNLYLSWQSFRIFRWVYWASSDKVKKLIFLWIRKGLKSLEKQIEFYRYRDSEVILITESPEAFIAQEIYYTTPSCLIPPPSLSDPSECLSKDSRQEIETQCCVGEDTQSESPLEESTNLCPLFEDTD